MIKEKQETARALNEAQQVMQQQEIEIKRLNEELYEEEPEEHQSSMPPVEHQMNEQQRMRYNPWNRELEPIVPPTAPSSFVPIHQNAPLVHQRRPIVQEEEEEMPFANIQLKPKEPSTFSGGINDDVITWLNEVNSYYQLFARLSQRQRVYFAGSLLKGAAKDWWVSEGQQDAENWSIFQAKIKSRFASSTREHEARINLQTLQQRSGENVRTYSSKFIALCERLEERPEKWLLDMYLRGLHKDIATSVAIARPVSLQEVIQQAEFVDIATRMYGSSSSNLGQQQQRGQGTGGRSGGNWRGRGGGRKDQVGRGGTKGGPSRQQQQGR